jgi:hypothetical protein
MIYDEKMTAPVLIRFLNRLLREAKKKVCLILDHLRIHHAKLVKSWVQEDKEKIKLFHFTSDSPDLNPDQDFNCDLKTHPNQKLVPKKKEELKDKILGLMRSIQKSQRELKNIFGLSR